MSSKIIVTMNLKQQHSEMIKTLEKSTQKIEENIKTKLEEVEKKLELQQENSIQRQCGLEELEKIKLLLKIEEVRLAQEKERTSQAKEKTKQMKHEKSSQGKLTVFPYSNGGSSGENSMLNSIEELDASNENLTADSQNRLRAYAVSKRKI